MPARVLTANHAASSAEKYRCRGGRDVRPSYAPIPGGVHRQRPRGHPRRTVLTASASGAERPGLPPAIGGSRGGTGVPVRRHTRRRSAVPLEYLGHAAVQRRRARAAQTRCGARRHVPRWHPPDVAELTVFFLPPAWPTASGAPPTFGRRLPGSRPVPGHLVLFSDARALDAIREEINARLEELRSLARQASDLQRDIDALNGIPAATPAARSRGNRNVWRRSGGAQAGVGH